MYVIADRWALPLSSKGSSNFYLNAATRYYYIENAADVPTDGGNYWYYDTDGNIAIWS